MVFSASMDESVGSYTIRVADASNASLGSASVGETATNRRWIAAGQSSKLSLAFDQTRITTISAGLYRIWERRIYLEPQRNSKGDLYDRSLSQVDIDCARGRSRLVNFVDYLRDKVVNSADYEDSDSWSAVVPESIGETQLQAVCAHMRS